MNWHTDITIGDLHYLRSKFALSRGANGIYLGSFVKATEVFYYSKQFRVNGDYFLTWAFMMPEWEVDYLSENMNWLDHITEGNPWIIEANMPGKSLSAMKELRSLIPIKILRFKRGYDAIGKIILP